jgi:alpha-L-rhamnosidase
MMQLPFELRPRFTWHGFQFALFNASNDGVFLQCAPAGFVGVRTHTALVSTGELAFDGGPSRMLNQLQTIVRAGQLSNVAAGMPTDCPTREKHGWLGDAQVTAEEAMFNFDMAAVYTEYVRVPQFFIFFIFLFFGLGFGGFSPR